MKGLVILVVIGFLACMGFWFVMNEMSKDPGKPIAVAFGNAKGDKIEMHVVVQLAEIKVEPARDMLRTGNWQQQWVDRHFALRTASGDLVPMVWCTASNLVNENKVGGVVEGYAVAKLKPNTDYVCDYVPLVSESKRYTRGFTAPSEKQEAKRMTFAPATEK